jgi:hypothetical protein
MSNSGADGWKSGRSTKATYTLPASSTAMGVKIS